MRAPDPRALVPATEPAPLHPADLAAAGGSTWRAVWLAPWVGVLVPLGMVASVVLGEERLAKQRQALPLAAFIAFIAVALFVSGAIAAVMPLVLAGWMLWFRGPLLDTWRTTRPHSEVRRRYARSLIGSMALLLLAAAALLLGAGSALVMPLALLGALAIQSRALALFAPEPEQEGAVMRAVDQHARASDLHIEPQPWGLQLSGWVDGVLLDVVIERALAPPLVVVRAVVPGLEPTLRISLGSSGLSLRDPILDGLLHVEGVPEDRARALLADLHAEVLSVVHGNPGSTVEASTVVLRAYGPDPKAPEAWLRQRLEDVAELVQALQARTEAQERGAR